MRLEPYQAYRNSGIEWMPSLPAHWEMRRLKLLAKTPLTYGANESAQLDERDYPRYIRITDIKEDGTLYDGTFRSLEPEIAEPFLLEDGDILLARSGATVGKSFIYESSWGIAAYAGYLIRFRTDAKVILAKFAFYFSRSTSYWANINSTLIQSTIQNFSAEKYGNIVIPLPSLDEQKQIADFLDYKTAQIDRLIEKKKRLLEKLNEKRVAVITRAVTRGLDPAVPMKDSGVDWLGEVPAYWEVTSAKMCFDIQLGKMLQTKAESLGDIEVPYLKALHVNWDGVTTENLPQMFASETDIAKYQVSNGDLLVCEGGEVGRASILKDLQETAIIQNALHRVRGSDLGNIRYFCYLLANIADAGWFEILCNKATIAHLTGEKISAIRIPIPNLAEQKQIADFLDYKSSRIARQISKITEAIDKLTEYRTALITAAVTGKIDVRNVKIPNKSSLERESA